MVRRLRRNDIVTLSVAFIFIFFGASVQQVVVPVLQDAHADWDSGRVRTAVLTAVYLSFAVWRGLIGFVLRALGGYRTTVLGAAIYAVFFASIYHAPSPLALTLLAILWGFGAACLWTGASAAVLNASRSTHFGRSAGLFNSGTHLGYALGVFALVGVGHQCGYRASEWLIVPATVIGALITTRISREQPRTERPNLALAARVLRSPRGACVALFMLVSSSAYGIMLGPFVDQLSATHRMDALAIAGLYALARLAMTYLGGAISDGVGRASVIMGGFALAAVGLLTGAAMPGSLAAMMVCVISLGLQSEVVPAAGLALIGDTTEAARRPLVHGLLFAWRDLGVVLALQLGALLPATGASYLTVFGVLFATCALLASRLRGISGEGW